MGKDETKHSSKHKRAHDVSGDREHKLKRRHKDRGEDEGSSKKRKGKRSKGEARIHGDDVKDDDMWEEKNIDMEGEISLAADIPTAESLKLTSRATGALSDPPLPKPAASETALKRDVWMLDPTGPPTIPNLSSRTGGALEQDESLTEGYGETSSGNRNMGGTVDFFSSLGTEHKKKQTMPDPMAEPKVSHRELNVGLREGKTVDEYETPAAKAITPGGPGSSWRMMKLRRVYETAEEEGTSVEEVAIERFGSLGAFEEAKEERRILDEREGRRGAKGATSKSKGKEPEVKERFMFTDLAASGASSRSSSFRRPDLGTNTPSTPSPAPGEAGRAARRGFDSLRLPSQGGTGSPLAQSHTPIPSVMTPAGAIRGRTRTRALSPSSLNKLQAKVLRAKLTSASNANALEKEYEEELRKVNTAEEEGGNSEVQMLPTLDARGRLYDVGQGKDDGPALPGNRKKKQYVETRDPKTGELVRVNADDDEITLGEMLRQERFNAGQADQKNLDMEFAKAIATDSGFQANLDYMDDNAERLGRKKMRSDAMKRQFAINDYKKTQQVLATCAFCYGEDDSLPKAPVVAMGTRAYLSCTLNEELVEGHCLIIPIQHHLAMLEADDDVWDEVRNFMKCIMRMFAEDDKGVVFYETVINLKHQKHTCIECVPLPWAQFEELPGYFHESILMSETEWSQHQKLIDFSKRKGGFRRAMVPNLPYFMVQFDYKGEKGYGHVIEGTSEAADEGAEDGAIDEGAKGGGEFPRYFAAEIIGNVLEIEPRKWRRPRKIDFRFNKERTSKFRQMYEKFDWTSMIERQ